MNRYPLLSRSACCLFLSWFVGLAAGDEPRAVRIATYNIAMYGKAAGQVRDRLRDGRDRQAEAIASVVQTVRPDVMLVNEIDYDRDNEVATLLAEKFFAVGQGDKEPIVYPFVRSLPSNTGVDSGLDLNANGKLAEPADAWGYGVYPGQYAMAIFSRFPIDDQAIRTFQKFRWKDLDGALRPTDPETNRPYYPDEVWSTLRLSSKNHVDVPVLIGGTALHVLASHPTPPVFDGREDRNGCRNHDEVRFWIDYLDVAASQRLIDDRGRRGGIAEGSSFVIMGDLNADADGGDGRREAIKRLLGHRLVTDPEPSSAGAAESDSATPPSDPKPALATTSFGGNRRLRLDYVLPSRNLELLSSGVHWPLKGDADRKAVEASDHRLVWIDVKLSRATVDR